jgi:hypothetical protein
MNRRILNLALCSIGISSFSSACADKETARVVRLYPDKIKNLEDLIREIKIGAADRMPSNFKIEDIYKKLAEAFVEHAQDAIQAGISIPNAIRDKIPLKKRVVVPALMIFTMWGIQFIIPIATFFNVILGSIAVMGVFIYTAISAVVSKPKVSA